MPLDVLHAQDAVLWWVQRSEVPLQIAGLALFEAAPLRDASRSLRLDELTERVEAALGDAPRFRQRVRQLPLAQGVAWEDDDDFDIAHHISTGRVPEPGDDAQLAEAVARILEEPLDPDRPLWEIRLLDGLIGDRVALVLKASHVLLDGTALLELALRLLDPTPEPRPLPPAPPWRPARPSGVLERVAAGTTARIGQVAGGLRQAGAILTDPRLVAGAVEAAVDLASTVVRGQPDAAPRLPLTGRVGPRRAVAWTKVPLEQVRRVARAESVTVNDVVLAMATGALADSTGAGHPRPPVRDPRVVVPLSVHDTVEEARNRFSVIVTELPLNLSDPLERLCQIHTELLPRREAAPTSMGARVFALAGLVPPWLLRIAGRVALDHQPVADLAITNLRGPGAPMYLMGARMLEAYPLVSGTGNLATIIGVLSYGDSLGICVTVDADVVPDPAALLAGFPRSLRNLVRATRRAR